MSTCRRCSRVLAGVRDAARQRGLPGRPGRGAEPGQHRLLPHLRRVPAHPGVVRRATSNATLEAINFYRYLSESVYVIWYEAPADVESTHAVHAAQRRPDPSDRRRTRQGAAAVASQRRKRDARSPPSGTPSSGISASRRCGRSSPGGRARRPTHISLLLDTLAVWPKGERERPLFHTFETLRPRSRARRGDVERGRRPALAHPWAGTTTATSSTRSATWSPRGRTFGELVERCRRRCTKREFEAGARRPDPRRPQFTEAGPRRAHVRDDEDGGRCC